MKEITQIKKIGNGNRYHLYLDEQHFGIFEAEVLARYCLKSGQSYDDDFFEKLKIENGDYACFNRGLSILEKSLKSEKMLYDFLKGKGYPIECVTKAIEKLKSYGYIDDKAYCESYINSYPSKSLKKLKYDLLAKGIDSELIDHKLAELSNDELEEEKALKEARKYLKNKDFDLKIKQKFYNHMVGKGFDCSQIQKAWEEVADDRN